MRLKQMTATFGRLEQETLLPAAGLTVITAPNEAGKSTWAGFLRAMLYGINTREKDKAGYIAEKNRYAPWSGAPMSGELRLEWRGRDITLRRFAQRSSPFGGFEAVYTASGDPVPELTAANAGELLVGAGREMYERSAFVGQGGTAVTGAAELEKRIAALVSSGEEEVSYSETERRLKDWQNRRRSNRSNGLLPELDGALAEVERDLDRLSRTREQLADAEGALSVLREEQAALTRELEVHKRLRQKELNRRYAKAREELTQAELRLAERSVGDADFGAMTGEEAWAYAMRETQRREEILRENQAKLELRKTLQREAGEAGRRSRILLLCMLIAAAVLLAGGAVLRQPLLFAGALVPLGFAIPAWNMARAGKAKLLDAESLEFQPVPEDENLLERAAAYRETLARLAQAQSAADSARKLVETLAAQGAVEFDTLEYLAPPPRSAEETAARLGVVTGEAARLERQQAQAQGTLSAVGDPDVLEARRNEILAQSTARTEELEAIETARAALAEANDILRQRFSPTLNQRAGALFAQLTGGRYRGLSLTRSFEAAASPEGGLLPRSSLLLSQGTVDQLYLAVRLAVCELTLSGEESAPLILDDALINFDDARMERALDLLLELSRERQILLFTCHGREAQWAKNHHVRVLDLHSSEK